MSGTTQTTGMAADALAGRHALVTGGSAGIGAAIAAALTAAGARVTILGRREAALTAARERGIAAGAIVADVADEGRLKAAIAEAVAAAGPIAILVNNAGAAETAAFRKAGVDQFRRMIDQHLMAPVIASQAVLPGMIAAGHGRIVTVAATAALKGYRYVSAYTAAKHAALGLTRSLALECAGTGVTVNAVCPGFTETEMVGASFAATAARQGRQASDVLKDVLADKPLGRLIRPAEVASAVLWLCSEAAGAVTGQTLVVDGGETAG